MVLGSAPKQVHLVPNDHYALRHGVQWDAPGVGGTTLNITLARNEPTSLHHRNCYNASLPDWHCSVL